MILPCATVLCQIFLTRMCICMFSFFDYGQLRFFPLAYFAWCLVYSWHCDCVSPSYCPVLIFSAGLRCTSLLRFFFSSRSFRRPTTLSLPLMCEAYYFLAVQLCFVRGSMFGARASLSSTQWVCTSRQSVSLSRFFMIFFLANAFSHFFQISWFCDVLFLHCLFASSFFASLWTCWGEPLYALLRAVSDWLLADL